VEYFNQIVVISSDGAILVIHNSICKLAHHGNCTAPANKLIAYLKINNGINGSLSDI